MKGDRRMKDFRLREEALSHPLVAAHRGACAGNIPCNTIDAFHAALCQGADIIELDVTRTKDNCLLVFHPGMEPAHLSGGGPIRDLTRREAENLVYVNYDRVPTKNRINTLDEVLECLKGRCYINIDKFWDNVELTGGLIRRHGMEDQILVKSAPSERIFQRMEQQFPQINYMVIVKGTDSVTDRLRGRKMNYVGAEVLFAHEQEQVATKEYVEEMSRRGLLTWVNGIVYNYLEVLSAGHNDDVSITGHMEDGWGWLLERGYHIIQTDWPLALRRYMDMRGGRPLSRNHSREVPPVWS